MVELFDGFVCVCVCASLTIRCVSVGAKLLMQRDTADVKTELHRNSKGNRIPKNLNHCSCSVFLAYIFLFHPPENTQNINTSLSTVREAKRIFDIFNIDSLFLLFDSQSEIQFQ